MPLNPDPEVELAQWVALGSAMEERVRARIQIAIMQAYEAAWRNLAFPESGIKPLRETLQVLLAAHYRDTVRAFALREITSGRKGWAAIERKESATLEEIVDRVRQWISATALTMSSIVSETVRERLKKIISDGYSAGKAPDSIARDIRTEGMATSDAHARTIARTETYRAADQGQREGIRTLGVTVRSKQWVTAYDHRVRPDHRTVRAATADEANRYEGTESYTGDTLAPFAQQQTPRRRKMAAYRCPVHEADEIKARRRRAKPNLSPGSQDWPIAPVDGMFVCGGVVCYGPRDPVLPASLAVNCRCVLSYREEEADAPDGALPPI